MKNKKLTLLDMKSYRYFFLRLVRQRQTPQNLAFSVALGVFIGCLVPFGQTPTVLFLAFLFRCNKLVAMACVWYSNPITIPPLFALNIYLGSRFLGAEARDKISGILENWQSIEMWTNKESWLEFGQSGILSFAIGGTITGIISATACYFASFFLVKSMRVRKEQRLLKRQEQIRREYQLKEPRH